jgi:hypothetical protein
MSDIRLDRGKAERLIALLLRDDHKLSPAAANDLATQICVRLQASMAMPTSPRLQGYRMIGQSPPYGTRPAILADLGKLFDDLDDESLSTLWAIVHRYCHDLPDDVVV